MWNKWTCKWKPYHRVSVLLNDYSWSFRAYQIMNNFGYRYLVRGRVSCIDMMVIKIILLLMLLIKIEIANLVLTNITLCIYWSCWDGLIWVDLNMVVGMRICLIVTRFFLMKNTLNDNSGYNYVGDNVGDRNGQNCHQHRCSYNFSTDFFILFTWKLSQFWGLWVGTVVCGI